MFILSEEQVEKWNTVIEAAIDAGGLGLDIAFWKTMLIPPAPLTQEEVNKLYLENCPRKNCAVCVYLRGM